VKSDLQNITAFRLELLNDPNLPLGGPGRSLKGTAALTEFEVEAAPADAPTKAVAVKIVKATADIALPERPLEAIFDDKTNRTRVTGPVDYAIDGKEETAWEPTLAQACGISHAQRSLHLRSRSQSRWSLLTFYLSQKHGGWNSDDNQSHNLGRFRLSVTQSPDAVADPLPRSVREILATPAAERTPAQVKAVFGFWRTTVPEFQEANAHIEQLWQKHPQGSYQLALLAREEMRDTHILTRGDFLKPGKTVAPGVPAFLNPLPKDAPPNRLTFANGSWIVNRRRLPAPR
jgi:hypothetical protein